MYATVPNYSFNASALHIQGDAMYAEIPQEVIEEKAPLLNVGKTYVIEKFKVSNVRPTYKPLNAHLMIEFTDFTSIEPSQKSPNMFPAYVYVQSHPI